MDDIQADLDLKVKGATDASQDSARTYQSSQWGVVAMSLVAVGLGLFLAVFTSRLIAGPVQQVALVARQVAGGDLTHEDLKVYAEDEIGELARSVNEMQANLREMIGSVFRQHREDCDRERRAVRQCGVAGPGCGHAETENGSGCRGHAGHVVNRGGGCGKLKSRLGSVAEGGGHSTAGGRNRRRYAGKDAGMPIP